MKELFEDYDEEFEHDDDKKHYSSGVICSVCGKRFTILPWQDWGYKVGCLYQCGYTCYCKQLDKNLKKKNKNIEKELQGERNIRKYKK